MRRMQALQQRLLRHLQQLPTVIIFWSSRTFPGSESRALPPADWLPQGLAQDQLVTLRLGSETSCKTEGSEILRKAVGSDGILGREGKKSHFPLPGGSPAGSGQPCCLLCVEAEMLSSSLLPAAGSREGPDLQKGF